jgi:hypothetical protein
LIKLNKNQKSIFKFKVKDIDKINSLEMLKDYLIENKIVHSKYKNKITGMSISELKNFIYTGYYEEVEFEGVAPLLTAICNNQIKDALNIINNSKLSHLSFLRLLIYSLQKEDNYSENKFGYYLKNFKLRYEVKFKKLLFELGQKFFIDKLDIINFFIKLMQ